MSKAPKSRGWKVVAHNVDPQGKPIIEGWLKSKKVRWSRCAYEPYEEDENRVHLHIFCQFPEAVHQGSILKDIQQISKKYGTPKPPEETRDWNRVDAKTMCVKEMKKTVKNCEDYLLGETKDKPTGEMFVITAKPCGRRVRLTKNQKYEEFCFYCTQADCLGCCPGCFICTPTTGHDELIRRNAIIKSQKVIKKSLKNNLHKIITPGDGPFALPKIDFL